MAKFEPVVVKVEVEFGAEDRERLDQVLTKLTELVEELQLRTLDDHREETESVRGILMQEAHGLSPTVMTWSGQHGLSLPEEH